MINLLSLFETDSNVKRLKYFAVARDFIANISGAYSRFERFRELYYTMFQLQIDGTFLSYKLV